MMNGRYILKDKIPVLVDDLIEWAKAFEKMNRQVAKDAIGDVSVSTVFLALDHQFGKGKPILFETMVFGGELDGEQDRYHTWEEAEEGHKNMVKRVNHEQATLDDAKREMFGPDADLLDDDMGAK